MVCSIALQHFYRLSSLFTVEPCSGVPEVEVEGDEESLPIFSSSSADAGRVSEVLVGEVTTGAWAPGWAPGWAPSFI